MPEPHATLENRYNCVHPHKRKLRPGRGIDLPVSPSKVAEELGSAVLGRELQGRWMGR